MIIIMIRIIMIIVMIIIIMIIIMIIMILIIIIMIMIIIRKIIIIRIIIIIIVIIIIIIPFSVSFHKAARSDAHELRWKIRSSFELSQQLLTCHAACKGNQLRTKSNQAFSTSSLLRCKPSMCNPHCVQRIDHENLLNCSILNLLREESSCSSS